GTLTVAHRRILLTQVLVGTNRCIQGHSDSDGVPEHRSYGYSASRRIVRDAMDWADSWRSHRTGSRSGAHLERGAERRKTTHGVSRSREVGNCCFQIPKVPPVHRTIVSP